MKNKLGRIALALLLAGMLAFWSGCILEEKVIEIILTSQTCAEFHQEETQCNFVTPEEVDAAEELLEILEDNGYELSDLESINLVSVSYTVTDFPAHPHDWLISGSITVERVDIADGPVNIVDYGIASIAASVGTEIFAPLNADGVALINRAFADFLLGDEPVLLFTVVNGDCDPEPSPTDILLFDWEMCVYMHVVVSSTYDVPDIF